LTARTDTVVCGEGAAGAVEFDGKSRLGDVHGDDLSGVGPTGGDLLSDDDDPAAVCWPGVAP
jgi:hypothetical protein